MDKIKILINKLNVISNYKVEIPSINYDSLTSSDAASALSGLSECEYWITHMYITNRKDYIFKIFSYVLDKSIDLAMKENWKLPKNNSLLEKFTEQSICELMVEKICQKCRGSGQYLNKNLMHECEKCIGTGVGTKTTDSTRANFFEIGLQNYLKYWKIRYNKISQIPYEMLENGLAYAVRRLENEQT